MSLPHSIKAVHYSFMVLHKRGIRKNKIVRFFFQSPFSPGHLWLINMLISEVTMILVIGDTPLKATILRSNRIWRLPITAMAITLRLVRNISFGYTVAASIKAIQYRFLSEEDHVNSVYNQCDLVHSLSILAGKILHWFYRKVYILCHNFHINPRVMKVKPGQVLRCAPFDHIKSWHRN